MNLVQTFFTHPIHLLHQRVTTMWMYSGPSCTDCPFSMELGDVEVNTWIHKVLAHGSDQNPGANPAPLREGVDSIRVSLPTFAFGNLRSLIWPLCSCLHARPSTCS
jgi:hypothetical protein